MAEVQIRGFKELDAELKILPLKVQQTIMGKVVRAGANVVLKAARDNAPARSIVEESWRSFGAKNPPGFLKSRKGIIVRRAKNPKAGHITDLVGISPKAFYGLFIEKGWNLTLNRKRGKKQVRFISARPFLRPAFDNNRSRIIARMRVVFGLGILRYKRGAI